MLNAKKSAQYDMQTVHGVSHHVCMECGVQRVEATFVDRNTPSKAYANWQHDRMVECSSARVAEWQSVITSLQEN